VKGEPLRGVSSPCIFGCFFFFVASACWNDSTRLHVTFAFPDSVFLGPDTGLYRNSIGVSPYDNNKNCPGEFEAPVVCYDEPGQPVMKSVEFWNMMYRSCHISTITPALLLVVALSATSLAQKTDVIVLYNGDRITGEVKEMQTGLLKLSTDNLGTVYIEWNKITDIQSDKYFEVELSDGRIYFGTFEPSDSSGTIIVKGVTVENRLFLRYIVKITTIRESFWDILDGFVKLGISYNKSNKVGELNFGADGIYTTISQRTELILNSDFSGSAGNPTSSNNSASLSFNKFLENKWFWGAIAIAEQNSSLGLRLRTTLGAAVGNDFVKTGKSIFNGVAGLTGSKEWYEGKSGSQDNLTLYLSSKYQVFIYETPGISVFSFLSVYPYLTNLGRIRVNYSLSFDWEIIGDLYWELGFYMDYDNRPRSTDASRVDYSIRSGIKYNI